MLEGEIDLEGLIEFHASAVSCWNLALKITELFPMEPQEESVRLRRTVIGSVSPIAGGGGGGRRGGEGEGLGNGKGEGGGLGLGLGGRN